MSQRICSICLIGEVVEDKRVSGSLCMHCGECFDLGAFTDEVAFREDERGRYKAMGASYNVEKGFASSQYRSQRQIKASLDKARETLKRYCDKLCIGESFAKTAVGFYEQLLAKKFMNGRRSNVVLAACLYLSVRIGSANVILLDISDIAEANVYDIMRHFFLIAKIMNQRVQTVDPCEYTVRFVDMLNLGNRDLPQVKKTAMNIRDTANRLVQRMKRDWIHFGRRPSGVCAAAVMVAARLNQVNCTIQQIIGYAKVCESTVRKRINEFIDTPTSKQTLKQFLEEEDPRFQDQTMAEDPPSYKKSIMKSVNQENLKDAEKLQKEIEEKLRESRPSLRGAYSSFLKDLMKDTLENEEGEVELIKDTIAEECAENAVQQVDELDSTDNKGEKIKPEDVEYWTELRPTPESMGLGKNFAKYTQPVGYITIEDDDDVDEDEIDQYLILNEEEVVKRNLEWGQLNKEFLEEEEVRRKRRAEDEANGIFRKLKPKKRKRHDDEEYIPTTTSEAVEAALKKKNISLPNINLKRLFNENADSEIEDNETDVLDDNADVEVDLPESEIEAFF